MDIELYGGPADGIRLTVPDETVLWIVKSPTMSTAEFLAWENEDPSARMPEPQQLGYAMMRHQVTAAGARRFHYVGVRVSR